MALELTAKASIERNVKFWAEQCGLNAVQIRKEVTAYRNMAYSPAEQQEAINTWLRDNEHQEKNND